jgi:hypothetical protein
MAPMLKKAAEKFPGHAFVGFNKVVTKGEERYAITAFITQLQEGKTVAEAVEAVGKPYLVAFGATNLTLPGYGK